MYLEKFNTKKKLELFSVELERFLLEIFSTRTNTITDLLESSYDYEFAEVIKEILANEGLNKFDDVLKIGEVLRKIQAEINDIKVLSLKLAFVPSKNFITKIYTWLQDIGAQKIVLDLTYDESLLGGVVLTYMGKYKDYSVLRKLTEYDFRPLSTKK